MNAAPRRLPIFAMPPTTAKPGAAAVTAPVAEMPGVKIDPTKFSQRRDEQGAGWRVVEGLGPQGRALTVLPHRDTPTRLSPAEIREYSPMLEYRVRAAKAGDAQVIIDALPTHRLTPAHEVIAAVSINDGVPVVVHFDQGVDDENDATWQRNVLRGAMYGRATVSVPQGAYTLRVWAADCGVVLQQLSVNPK